MNSVKQTPSFFFVFVLEERRWVSMSVLIWVGLGCTGCRSRLYKKKKDRGRHEGGVGCLHACGVGKDGPRTEVFLIS